MAEPFLPPIKTPFSLTVSTQNCNSLNLTTNVRSYELKIAAIKNLNTDVIFLCDTRLVSSKGISGTKRLKDSFRDAKGKKYDVFTNSASNSRGVAILTDTALCIIPMDTFRDPEENFIFIKAKINNNLVLLGSVYGPNGTGRDFFRKVEGILERNQDCKVIIGGDWNTVWDTSSVDSNIDVFKMQHLPNKCNGELLRDLSARFSLLDPTRVLYPDARLFTYSPFGLQRLNKSRLDFFVVSGDLLTVLKECKPAIATATNLFDHKSVTLTLGMSDLPTVKQPPKLRNSNLDNPLLQNYITLAAYKCYSFGIRAETENDIHAPIRAMLENLKQTTRQIANKLAEVLSMLKEVAAREETPRDEMLISAIFAEIGIAFSDLPSLDILSQFPKKNDAGTFFEAIALQTKLAGIKAQKQLYYLQNLKKKRNNGKNHNTKGKFRGKQYKN